MSQIDPHNTVIIVKYVSWGELHMSAVCVWYACNRGLVVGFGVSAVPMECRSTSEPTLHLCGKDPKWLWTAVKQRWWPQGALSCNPHTRTSPNTLPSTTPPTAGQISTTDYWHETQQVPIQNEVGGRFCRGVKWIDLGMVKEHVGQPLLTTTCMCRMVKGPKSEDTSIWLHST